MPRITDAARSGAGVGWHERHDHVFEGCERFFRPGYNANLVTSWLPALDGVVEKLERGAKVADLGCGHGSSTILMAQAYANSTFVGSDYHEGSIDTAIVLRPPSNVCVLCATLPECRTSFSHLWQRSPQRRCTPLPSPCRPSRRAAHRRNCICARR